MKVKELIEILSKSDPEKEIKVTWEGITETIKPENIYMAACGTILIDADENLYKEEFQKGK